MDQESVGQQLRSLRAAAGRTVSSVAQEAGLSVPYIANLENGRGNPTLTALSRLAAALGTRLTITLVPASGGGPQSQGSPGMPASLVRLGRTHRFRRTIAVMARELGVAESDLSVQLVSALAGLAEVWRADLGEADWWRLLDALLLIVQHPAR